MDETILPVPTTRMVSESPPFPEEPIDECTRVRTRVYFPNPPCCPYHDHVQIRNDVLIPSSTNNDDYDDASPIYAYMILDTLDPIRQTIYGHVYKGRILKKRQHSLIGPSSSPTSSPCTTTYCEWEATDTYCAIKEMEWDKIHHGQEMNQSENALKEMDAMQYIKKKQQQSSSSSCGTTAGDSRLMTALDILNDDVNIYCIMPFLDDGDLFDVMDDYITSSTNNKDHDGTTTTTTTPTSSSGRLPENICKYWFKEILLAVKEMHQMGICHRDLSLENIMVGPNQRAIIIDWGMCLRIPTFINDENGQVERCYISKRERCGKYIYMSPEVFNSVNNHEDVQEDDQASSYDTHALDLWSVGVILLTMSIGDFQWEMPNVVADERFRLLTDGNLSWYLKEWDMGLSDDLMDLLEGMLMINPQDRYTMEDIWNHSWMR